MLDSKVGEGLIYLTRRDKLVIIGGNRNDDQEKEEV
jgi:hypothetical protein